jgi:two-component system C4-dicarboxylate transport sensor histidine kinase DctB
MRRLRGLAPYAVALAACLLAGWLAYGIALSAQLNSERTRSAARLDFFTLSLENLLSRNEALPGLMVLERKLGAVLDGEGGARDAANHYLEAVAQAARISAAYLMDGRGLTLAASNWNQPVNFVGQNYAFRPYVQEALAGSFGRFYGIGATTGEAGFFLASKLRSAGGAPGVIAVKVSLDPFEDALKQSGEAVLVVDREGVVLLSSVSEWKYKLLQPLDAAARERIARTRQYGEQPLPPLAPEAAIGADRGEARIVRAGVAGDYTIVRRAVGTLGWQMLILTDERSAKATAAVAATAAAALAAVVAGVFLHLLLTRRQREEQRRAERALQAVSAELERKTLELKRTDAILQQARDAAVQAGKLTMLGQMSAGMTHELNQPLAALHTLSDNAVQLIEHERVAEARENLVLIGQLAQRMGRIVTQLKVFARKEPAAMGPVSVARAVDNALMIVEPTRRESGVGIQAAIDPALQVQADAVRLEQVLVNLLRNGLDALAGREAPLLRVSAERAGAQVRIAVQDNGAGIAEETLAHLFEPFHTTKPAGQGLGLGLALSLAIVEGFGGQLAGRNLAGGGAEFSVTLQAA